MRQFKIVELSPDTKNGLTIANFGMPIKLLPDCQITLDKFCAQIDIRNTKILLQTEQTFTVQTYVGGPIYLVTIPAKTYETSTDLINAIRQNTNNVWNALDDDENNYGLKYDIQITNDKVLMSYVSVVSEGVGLNTGLTIVDGNCATDTTGIIVGFGGGNVYYTYRSAANQVLQGGGFSVFFSFRPDVIGGNWYTDAGIYTSAPNSYSIGLTQDNAVNPEIDVTSTFPGYEANFLIPSNVFYDGSNNPITQNVFIYQKNGFYCLQVRDFLGTILYTKENIAPFVVNQAMEIYGTGNGLINADPLLMPGAGVWTLTKEGGSTVDANLHTMSFRFGEIDNTHNSNTLRRGLSLPSHLVILPAPSTVGIYEDANPVDFSILNSALDIAIELLDMPLDSYIVGDGQYPMPMNQVNGRRQQGGRKNILAYFTPELSTSENVYRFAQSEYQWLDLINKMPIELSSLTFRVFEPATGKGLDATNFSFNFLIKDKDEFVKY